MTLKKYRFERVLAKASVKIAVARLDEIYQNLSNEHFEIVNSSELDPDEKLLAIMADVERLVSDKSKASSEMKDSSIAIALAKKLESKLKVEAIASNVEASYQVSSGYIMSTLSSTTSAPRTTKPSMKISEVIDDFIADINQGRAIKENTQNEYRITIRDLTEILGDVPVDRITYNDAKKFRNTLLKTPKNRNKIKKLKGLSIEELLALNLPANELIQGRAVSERIAHLKTIFKWLVARRLVIDNPFETISAVHNSLSYSEFTTKDLQAVFTSDLYQDSRYAKRSTTTAGHWWLPLVALFSGARPTELIQMRLSDVSEIEGILTATVAKDDEDNLQVKTKAGLRTFPIHPMLITLGFDRYLAALSKAACTRVLEGIKVGKRKAGDQAGKWFNEHYRSKFLPEQFKNEKKTLYSFRHTHITEA